jgi:hypothetical protein
VDGSVVGRSVVDGSVVARFTSFLGLLELTGLSATAGLTVVVVTGPVRGYRTTFAFGQKTGGGCA